MNKRYVFFSLFLMAVILAFTSATVRANDVNEGQLLNHYTTLTLDELTECQVLSKYLGFTQQSDMIVNLLNLAIMSEVVTQYEVVHKIGYYQGKLDTTMALSLTYTSNTEEEINEFFVIIHNESCLPKTEI